MYKDVIVKYLTIPCEIAPFDGRINKLYYKGEQDYGKIYTTKRHVLWKGFS